MPARIRSRVRVIVLGLLLVLLYGGPPAKGGECIGAQRARIEYMFLWLQHNMTSWADDIRSRIVDLGKPAIQVIFNTSVLMLQCESRWILNKLLTDEISSASKNTAEFKAFLDRAKDVLGSQPYALGPLGKLRQIVMITSGTFIVCQAIRQKNPRICAALVPFGLQSDCESMALKGGILFPKDCSDEVVSVLASAWNRDRKMAQKFCHAIKEQQPRLCTDIPNLPPYAQAVCRALAGNGVEACNHPSLGREDSQECRAELLVQLAMAGKTPLDALPEELTSQYLVLPGIRATLSSLTCDRLALDTYNEQTTTENLLVRF